MAKWAKTRAVTRIRSQSGQAFVEYIVMLAVALSIVTIIATTFRGTVMKLWTMMRDEVSAACPGCPPPPQDDGG